MVNKQKSKFKNGFILGSVFTSIILISTAIRFKIQHEQSIELAKIIFEFVKEYPPKNKKNIF